MTGANLRQKIYLQGADRDASVTKPTIAMGYKSMKAVSNNTVALKTMVYSDPLNKRKVATILVAQKPLDTLHTKSNPE